jgi:hypothetical protein
MWLDMSQSQNQRQSQSKRKPKIKNQKQARCLCYYGAMFGVFFSTHPMKPYVSLFPCFLLSVL